MALTYEPIATQTMSGSSGGATFNSIPSTYTDLILVINGSVTSSAGVQMRFNGDTGGNYSFLRMAGDGSAASSDKSSPNQTFMELGYYISGVINNNVVHIMNYSNTTTYKTVLNRANAQTNAIGGMVFAELWRSTSAINSISVSTSTYTSGTMFTLYGIKAA